MIVFMKQWHTQWSDCGVLNLSQMKVQRQTQEEIGQNWKRESASGWVEKKLWNMSMYDTVLLHALWRILTIMGLQYVSVHESKPERERWRKIEWDRECKCVQVWAVFGTGAQGVLEFTVQMSSWFLQAQIQQKLLSVYICVCSDRDSEWGVVFQKCLCK